MLPTFLLTRWTSYLARGTNTHPLLSLVCYQLFTLCHFSHPIDQVTIFTEMTSTSAVPSDTGRIILAPLCSLRIIPRIKKNHFQWDSFKTSFQVNGPMLLLSYEMITQRLFRVSPQSRPVISTEMTHTVEYDLFSNRLYTAHIRIRFITSLFPYISSGLWCEHCWSS